MKAVLIGQPEEVCADSIENELYKRLKCSAVWNVHKLPEGFGPLVRIFASFPAVIFCDVVVLLPGYNKNWYTYFEYILAKVLCKVIMTHEDVIPIEIKYDEKKHAWKFATQFLKFRYDINKEEENEKRAKQFNLKKEVDL